MASNREEIIIAEDDGQSGLTFRKLGRFLKRSFSIALVTALCCILVFTAIYAAILVMHKNQTSYVATQIVYTDENMANGNDPFGNPFNMNSLINLAYVESALQNSELERESKTLIEALSVRAVFDRNVLAAVKGQESATINGSTIMVSGAEYHANTIELNLNYGRMKDPFTLSEAQDFLNAYTEAYLQAYAKKYGNATLDTYSFAKSNATEYIAYVSNTEAKLRSILSSLKELQAQNAAYRSDTGITFSRLIDEMTVYQQELESIANTMTVNAVANNLAESKSFINTQVSKLTQEVEELGGSDGSSGRIGSLAQQIKDYKLPSKTVTNDSGQVTEITYEDTVYQQLNLQLDALRAERADKLVLLAAATARKTALDAATDVASNEIKAKTDERIVQFADEMETYMQKAADAAKSILTNRTRDSVRLTTSAVLRYDNPSVTDILLTYLVVVILVYLLGLGVYAAIEMRRKRKLAAAAAETELIETEQNEQAEPEAPEDQMPKD